MMTGKKRSIPTDSDAYAPHKEWDEVFCPICLDHPHNAVLLLCGSHEKDCRPYICDTSYRHSNCLDRFRKMKMDSDSFPPINQQNPNNTADRSGALGWDDVVEVSEGHYPRERSSTDPGNNDNHDIQLQDLEMDRTEKINLKCPLCRGDVLGWKVVKEVRRFLNMKTRTCSSDSCQFVGNYHELRRHARSVHPSARPAEIDPSRQQAWKRFEHQREHDDVVSAVWSTVPGAIVLGDYVIENGNNDGDTAERVRTLGELNEPSWTTGFLFRILGEPRSRSRAIWSRHRRIGEALPRRRYLWGENLFGARDESDGDSDHEVNVIHVNDDEPSVRRRRFDEVSVTDVDDHHVDDNHDDLPDQGHQNLTQMRSNGDEP